MSESKTPKLFQPIKVGDLQLQHRVVLAPLTRFRADSAHVHTDMGVEYYKQRASVRGTLLISEATYIAAQAGGMPNVPGIWTDAQIGLADGTAPKTLRTGQKRVVDQEAVQVTREKFNDLLGPYVEPSKAPVVNPLPLDLPAASLHVPSTVAASA